MEAPNDGRYTRRDPKEHLILNLDISSESECWNWTGQKNNRGYGIFKNKILMEQMGVGVATASPRAAYWIFKKPFGREWVLHHCDNPACCNPNHLYLGSPQDNVDDMVSRGRNSRGEDRPAAKLTEMDVREIRRLRGKRGGSRMKTKDIAAKFSIGVSLVNKIVFREAWKHVD